MAFLWLINGGDPNHVSKSWDDPPSLGMKNDTSDSYLQGIPKVPDDVGIPKHKLLVRELVYVPGVPCKSKTIKIIVPWNC